MNETQLKSIVAGGEKEDVDFKRSLHLKTKDEKAEFVKDISTIANSTDSRGYYLVGVNDDKTIAGTDQLKEEQIQQIINTYLNP
jgi:predicted HTH transcriptional regulator